MKNCIIERYIDYRQRAIRGDRTAGQKAKIVYGCMSSSDKSKFLSLRAQIRENGNEFRMLESLREKLYMSNNSDTFIEYR